MTIAMRKGLTLAAAMLAATGPAACNRQPDTGAVIVSAIGQPPALAGDDRPMTGTPDRLLADATAQGLVRLDAAGQVEPGLAERWIVIDDGQTYIFRLRDARWPDGRPVIAPEVARLLRREIGGASRNPLAPFLTAVGEVVAMTPQVIEMRLRHPRPDLLKLFAQPELRLAHAGGGTGPFRLDARTQAPLLSPVVAPDRDPDDPLPGPASRVRLIGERAALAVERFREHRSDLVAGGTVDDWPIVATAAGIAPANLRTDPAAGLFGLAVTSREGFLADPANRAAVAEAIDRAALTGLVDGGWAPAEQILPDRLDSAADPAHPAWAALSLADRRAAASARVAAWPSPVVLRLAVPSGPGGTLLWAAIASSLRSVGIAAERVASDAPADLTLVDAVAPYDSARWYLATACRLCGPEAAAPLDAARTAPTLAERGRQLALADAALAADTAFIPVARPFRWSLVALRLRQWQPNVRAWHPLNRLRTDPTSPS